jgi:hypothetical protein
MVGKPRHSLESEPAQARSAACERETVVDKASETPDDKLSASPGMKRRSYLALSLRALMVLIALLCGTFAWVRHYLLAPQREAEALVAMKQTMLPHEKVRRRQNPQNGISVFYGDFDPKSPFAPPSKEALRSPDDDPMPWRYAGKRPVKAFTMGLADMRGARAMLFSSFSQVRQIRVHDCQFSSEQIADLARCENLEALQIQHMPLSESDIAALARSRSIRHLFLQDVGLNDDGLKHISRMRQLCTLKTAQNPCTGRGLLGRVTELRSLEELRLLQCNVDDELLCGLAALPALRKLHLARGNISQRGIAALAHSQSLESVSCVAVGVNDVESFRLLLQAPRFQSLTLLDSEFQPLPGIDDIRAELKARRQLIKP